MQSKAGSDDEEEAWGNEGRKEGSITEYLYVPHHILNILYPLQLFYTHKLWVVVIIITILENKPLKEWI